MVRPNHPLQRRAASGPSLNAIVRPLGWHLRHQLRPKSRHAGGLAQKGELA
jgi:hypothetical protein